MRKNNPFLLVALGDFNAKLTTSVQMTKLFLKEIKIEYITSQFGLSQIINEPMYILDTSRSCIDLIFTSQPDLVIKSGVHRSLHQNCHHQVIYAQFNLHIYYALPYCRKIGHNQDANTDLLGRAILQFNWDKAFSNTNINEKVYIFNSRTILNILCNFVSHESII